MQQNIIDEKLALHQRYANVCNVPNRTIFCHDNLEVLQGINSECIDLIYLDPPFNKKKTFTAPIGSSAEGASFKDIFYREDIKEEWLQTIKEDYYEIYRLLEAVKDIEGRSSYNFCYLAYMAIRLIECYRILKNTGSIYLHCDPTMSHYIKMLLDCIFGEKRFRNEIVWCYTGPSNTKRWYPKKHDTLLFYSKGDSWIFNADLIRVSYKKLHTGTSKKGIFIDNKELNSTGKIPEDWWGNITPVGRLKNQITGYPTQKPIALLERVIKASSNEGDVVLDPFCGCATTCVAAEKIGNRHWIGIDISVKAYELVQSRIKKEVYESGGLLNGKNGYMPTINCKTSPPQRTDKDSGSKDRKYVYIVSHPKYRGEYKVGIASNVKSRLNSYQTSDPNRQYKLAHFVETEHYREVEAHIHDVFENKHEWVRAELKDIKAEMEKHKPKTAGGLFDETKHN